MLDGTYKISMAAARINAKKTQAEVAAALKVSKQTVVSWEKGKTSPTVKKAQEFCDFCGAPYDAVSFLSNSAI